jgi:hypothetical protein
MFEYVDALQVERTLKLEYKSQYSSHRTPVPSISLATCDSCTGSVGDLSLNTELYAITQ